MFQPLSLPTVLPHIEILGPCMSDHSFVTSFEAPGASLSLLCYRNINASKQTFWTKRNFFSQFL